MIAKKTILLMILDGFGIRKTKEFNGVLTSHMDYYFSLWNSYPHLQLEASGPAVGLPIGQMGSSEVGHLTLGSGKIEKEPLVRINEDFESNNISKHKILEKGLTSIKNKKYSNLHLMGLLSPGGVHSHQNHLFKLLEVYDSKFDFSKGEIFIHCFSDGRDVPQKDILNSLDLLKQKIKLLTHSSKIHIASVCGRFYAMDRDKRDERTQIAFDLLVNGVGEGDENYTKAINKQYKLGVYDEFLKPIKLEFRKIQKEDLVLCFNFRSDRPQQIISKLLEIKELSIQTLTEYNPHFNVDVFYPTHYPKNTLGELLSKSNKTQLRIAESEKFPHVTYFFNGLNHAPFKGEVDVKIASPKVATYDLQPEMSSFEVTRRVCKEIKSSKYDFILLNFANSDMVGHTGNLSAVQKALKEIDGHIREIKEALDEKEGLLLITADHGNCETMKDSEGNPHTKHTYNKVPFILCSNKYTLKKQTKDMGLSNIAPTLLDLFKIKKNKDMNDSLLK